MVSNGSIWRLRLYIRIGVVRVVCVVRIGAGEAGGYDMVHHGIRGGVVVSLCVGLLHNCNAVRMGAAPGHPRSPFLMPSDLLQIFGLQCL